MIWPVSVLMGTWLAGKVRKTNINKSSGEKKLQSTLEQAILFLNSNDVDTARSLMLKQTKMTSETMKRIFSSIQTNDSLKLLPSFDRGVRFDFDEGISQM